ncbi:MAG: hypothetical protein GF317_19480 [Candidatus Lokiarchaeota archaeon]|nr:hypothetical protein [Candidatus Lokiarchaeota archaeon]MBD3201678.1 hypothetical protein [Candidatus Lokiarchaeota archaeon]
MKVRKKGIINIISKIKNDIVKGYKELKIICCFLNILLKNNIIKNEDIAKLRKMFSGNTINNNEKIEELNVHPKIIQGTLNEN